MFFFWLQVSFSESGSLGNSSASDVTSLSSQLPDTPNSMVPSPIDTWRGHKGSARPPASSTGTRRDLSDIQLRTKKKRNKRTMMDYAFRCRREDLDRLLFPLHLGILARLAPWHFCRTQPMALMDVLGFYSSELYRTPNIKACSMFIGRPSPCR